MEILGAAANRARTWYGRAHLPPTSRASARTRYPALQPHTAEPRPQELKLAKTLWGVDESNDVSQWDALFARIKAEGFSAIEAAAPFWRKDTKLMQSLLEKHGLGLICQIHTTGGDIDAKTGEYIYCTSNKLHDHLASFMKLTSEAAALKPVLINSHSGHDSWGSGEKALAFLKQAIKVEKGEPSASP